MTVDARSEAFEYLLDWFNDHSYASTCRRLQLDVKQPRKGHRPSGSPKIRWSPATGRHLFFHDGIPLCLERRFGRGNGEDGSRDVDRRGAKETMCLTAIALRRDTLTDIAAEVVERYGRVETKTLRVFAPDGYGDWDLTHRVRKRPLSTVVTANGATEKLLADARRFLENEDFYLRCGLPWRRGYLLHGPPGTGKTSLIRAVASELDLELAILHLTNGHLDDAGLVALLGNAPENAALVLEDVDALFVGREGTGASARISFSGLLNAIDGPASQEGRMLFMTTNHPDRLDPALVRPGRVDMKLELGPCGPEELRLLYLNVFPNDEDGAARFAESFGTSRPTPSEVQQMLVAMAEETVEPICERIPVSR